MKRLSKWKAGQVQVNIFGQANLFGIICAIWCGASYFTFPLELRALPHPNFFVAPHTSWVNGPEKTWSFSLLVDDWRGPTCIAMQDWGWLVVGEVKVVAIPVGRHIPQVIKFMVVMMIMINMIWWLWLLWWLCQGGCGTSRLPHTSKIKSSSLSWWSESSFGLSIYLPSTSGAFLAREEGGKMGRGQSNRFSPYCNEMFDQLSSVEWNNKQNVLVLGVDIMLICWYVNIMLISW